MRRRPREPSPPQEGSEANLTDKLIDTINNLTANRELMNTKLSLLNGEGLKTASILEIGGMYRSLVTCVAVMYETEDFETKIAPHIEKRFEDLGKPSLIPGTIGSYIFGCYLSNYGMVGLNRFCTPICAASIRMPNKTNTSMRCTEKVIWTDGGETPVFILVEEDPANSINGKVFIPWVGDKNGFRGLTQGALDEIGSLGVTSIEIYGQLFNNQYIELLSLTPLSGITVVDRIRIRTSDYVSSKNGGVTDKIHKVNLKRAPGTRDDMKVGISSHSAEDNDDEKLERKMDTGVVFGIVIAILLALVIFAFIMMRRG